MERFRQILQKVYPILFYILLIGLFLKGEVFRIQTRYFSFTFTSVKNLTLVFIAWWMLLRIARTKRPHLSLWLGLVILIGAVSIIFSTNRIHSLYAGWILLVYIGWFYTLWTILQDSRHIIFTSILMVFIAGLVSVLDLWFHYSAGLGQIIERYPFWNGKNALGLFLVMSLCVCSGWFINKAKTRGVYLWLLSLNSIVLLLGIVFSYSRGAWMAGLVAVGGILLARLRRVVWIIIVCVVILLVISPPFLSKRFSSIFDIDEINIKNRFTLWTNTVEIFKTRPITGVGLGTFTEAYRERYPGTIPLTGEGSRIIRHTHNLYLQILTETGILGFVVFLGLVIGGLVRGVRNFLREPPGPLKDVRYGSLLGIVSLLVYSITDCTISWQFTGDSFSHINLIWILLWVCALKETTRRGGQ